MSGTTQRELQAHIIRTVIAAHEDGSVMPELMDSLTGSSVSEVDQALDKARRATSALITRVRAETARPSDQDYPGITANMQAYGDQQPYSPEQIAGMSMAEYSRHRAALGSAPRDLMTFLGGE